MKMDIIAGKIGGNHEQRREGKMIRLTIPGPPCGKQRARTFRHRQSGKIVSMTPVKTVNYEALVKQTFVAKYPDFIPVSGPIRMLMSIFVMPSKEAARKIKNRLETYPTIKPDISNIQKAIEDALNGLAYVDDKQIVRIDARKGYSDRPRVEIVVEEVT